MKKLLSLFFLLSATMWGQTVTVTADLKSLFGAAQAIKSQLCFSLTDGAGNQLSNPRTSSGVIVNTTTQCVVPDGAGHISTTVVANDQITPANSIYSVTYMYNGRALHGDIFQFLLADGTENLNTKPSLSIIPVIAAPTGDTTYARLDGGNLPFTAAVNTMTGYRINGPALLSHVLRGNGTNYVDAILAAADLSDGNSGTGAIAHVTSPVFVTPTLGAASATSIGAVSSNPFTALSGATGTNMAINLGRAVTETNIAISTGSGFFFTNADMVAGDMVLKHQTSGQRIYLGTGNSGASLAVTNAGLNFYKTDGTLPAIIFNDTAGGVQVTNNAGQSNRLIDASGNMYVGAGKALIIFGGTSGSTSVVASSTAGSTSLTLPAATDTLVGKATTDTLTNKTLTSPAVTNPTTTGTDSGSETLTTKRITPRNTALTTSTTFTANSDTTDIATMVMTGTAGTLTIAAPIGTPTDGQKLIFRINATNAQTYSFNATFTFSTTTVAPTTLAAGKTDYIGAMWNATSSKWDVVAVDQGR